MSYPVGQMEYRDFNGQRLQDPWTSEPDTIPAVSAEAPTVPIPSFAENAAQYAALSPESTSTPAHEAPAPQPERGLGRLRQMLGKRAMREEVSSSPAKHARPRPQRLRMAANMAVGAAAGVASAVGSALHKLVYGPEIRVEKTYPHFADQYNRLQQAALQFERSSRTAKKIGAAATWSAFRPSTA